MVYSLVEQQRGFTLVELIITIVMLSILAVGSIQFVSFSAQSYVQTVERSHHSNQASIINEKISRKLRNALPNSIRVTTDGACVEWIEIISASLYIQAPVLGSSSPDGEVQIIPVDGALPNTGYVTISPNQVSPLLYDNSRNPGSITPIPAVFTGTLGNISVYSIASGFRFEYGSAQQRLYFTSSPKAFCQQGNYLFSYENYGFVGDVSNLFSSLPSSLPNRKLISDSLITNSLQFSSGSSSLRRNSLLTYSYILRSGSSDERLVVNQEVQIRNVP